MPELKEPNADYGAAITDQNICPKCFGARVSTKGENLCTCTPEAISKYMQEVWNTRPEGTNAICFLCDPYNYFKGSLELEEHYKKEHRSGMPIW